MFTARGKVKMATVEAIVTRKDGTVENLGVVSYWHRNPLRRLWWRITQRLAGRNPGVARAQPIQQTKE